MSRKLRAEMFCSDCLLAQFFLLDFSEKVWRFRSSR